MFGLMAVAAMMTVSLTSCHKDKGSKQADYDNKAVEFTAGVDHIQALHRQTMHTLVDGKFYCWYESKVLFNDSLKTETLDDIKAVDVTDIFQTFNPDLCQYISSNIEKGTIIPAPVPDLWMEDFDLSYAEIKLTVTDVLQKLKEWNGVIPPAIGMTLRKPVGPKPCNAQWVMGNIMQVIFVDAVTGEVKEKNPAFEE